MTSINATCTRLIYNEFESSNYWTVEIQFPNPGPGTPTSKALLLTPDQPDYNAGDALTVTVEKVPV